MSAYRQVLVSKLADNRAVVNPAWAFAAKSHEAMREQLVPWYNTIVETRTGRWGAEELREQLL
jgi:hypothetical protein